MREALQNVIISIKYIFLTTFAYKTEMGMGYELRLLLLSAVLVQRISYGIVDETEAPKRSVLAEAQNFTQR
jgi:hypothetical protein